MERPDSLRDLIRRAGARPTPDICVVGSGVRVPGQFTREGIEALRACRAIYTLLPTSGVIGFLRELAPKVESLSHLYESGCRRSEIYDRVVATVLDAAAIDRPVGYVTAGNPAVLDRIAHGIRADGARWGFDVRVLPGISSIDTILVGLDDIGTTGLQVYEASWLVLHGIAPKVEVPCLLLQPHVFGTDYAVVEHEPLPLALAPLRDHLLQFYPPKHEVAFILSPERWFGDEQVYRVGLGDMCNVGEESLGGATLLIPRFREPGTDAALAARMADPAHFATAWRRVPRPGR